MGGVCVEHMGEKRNIYIVWWGIAKERGHSEVDGRKISEWFIRNSMWGHRLKQFDSEYGKGAVVKKVA